MMRTVDQRPYCSEVLFDGGLRLQVSIQAKTYELRTSQHHILYAMLAGSARSSSLCSRRSAEGTQRHRMRGKAVSALRQVTFKRTGRGLTAGCGNRRPQTLRKLRSRRECRGCADRKSTRLNSSHRL